MNRSKRHTVGQFDGEVAAGLGGLSDGGLDGIRLISDQSVQLGGRKGELKN
jgi:hypothetical protein